MLYLRMFDGDSPADVMNFYKELRYYQAHLGVTGKHYATYKLEYDCPEDSLDDEGKPINYDGIFIHVYKVNWHHLCQNIGYWEYQETLFLDKQRRMEIKR